MESPSNNNNTPPAFPTIKVSVMADNKITALEAANREFESADGSRTNVHYGYLSTARKALYEYVEMLEEIVGIEEPLVIKRFQ